MSLLPGRILPQTEPFGTLAEDGKTVMMDKNWWLLFYNMALQSIGTGIGIPADQLIDIESVDIDSVGTNAAALRAPIDALGVLMPTETDPAPSLQDVRNALILAYSALDSADAIVSGFAAPSAKVGLTPVAGAAQTAMRSDGAPPIDQTITPTWTAAHGFTGSPLSSTVTRVETGLANFKPSSTTSVNNTLTADAAMTVTCNETGWYDFEALLLITETTAGTGGFQFDFAAGSATLANTRYASSGISNGAAYANAARVTTSSSSFNPVTTGAAPDWSLCKGIIQVTVAGTFGLRWAQAATLAIDPTNLLVGSYIKLTKVG